MTWLSLGRVRRVRQLDRIALSGAGGFNDRNP
jgi:hypothetical protein